MASPSREPLRSPPLDGLCRHYSHTDPPSCFAVSACAAVSPDRCIVARPLLSPAKAQSGRCRCSLPACNCAVVFVAACAHDAGCMAPAALSRVSRGRASALAQHTYRPKPQGWAPGSAGWGKDICRGGNGNQFRCDNDSHSSARTRFSAFARSGSPISSNVPKNAESLKKYRSEGQASFEGPSRVTKERFEAVVHVLLDMAVEQG